MRNLIVFLVMFLFALPASAQIVDTPLQETTFVDFHDPGYLILKSKDGRTYSADFYYDTILNDDISTWEPNEKITIFLKKDVGMGIIREKTKSFYKVFFRQKSHPIEDILTKCLDGAKTSFEGCYMDAALHWKQEQLFILNNQKSLEYAVYAGRTEKAWQDYQKIVGQEFFNSREKENYALKSTYQAILNARLEKDRYYHLAHFLYFTNSYRDD